MAVALEEFATNDFESASLSRIVGRANIAKGSIYQYFADKRELYLHLVEECSRALLEGLAEAGAPPADGDVFDVIRWQMSATVAAAAAHPLEARFLERAYSEGTPVASDVQSEGRRTSEAHFTPMIAAAVERGEIRATIDGEVAEFVVRAVIGELGRFLTSRLGLEPGAREALASPEAERVFDQVTEVLRRGLAADGS